MVTYPRGFDAAQRAQWLVEQRIARFWRNVTKTDGCWLWTGRNRQAFGYGRVAAGLYAHRFSWWLHTGAYPQPGLFVCHHCDVPSCVRPEHLFLGTSADNMRDAYRKGRLDNSGMRNNKAKITVEMAGEIRAKVTGLRGEIKALAKLYNVSRGVIRKVLSGKHWTVRQSNEVQNVIS